MFAFDARSKTFTFAGSTHDSRAHSRSDNYSFAQAFAKKLAPITLLQSIPFGLYANATAFGVYDSLPNNFSKVAVYIMRSFDYPTPQLARRRYSV